MPWMVMNSDEVDVGRPQSIGVLQIANWIKDRTHRNSRVSLAWSKRWQKLLLWQPAWVLGEWVESNGNVCPQTTTPYRSGLSLPCTREIWTSFLSGRGEKRDTELATIALAHQGDSTSVRKRQTHQLRWRGKQLWAGRMERLIVLPDPRARRL